MIKKQLISQPKFTHDNKFINYVCPNPFIYAEIQGNGNVSTCCYIKHKFGNMNNTSLKSIWNSEDFKELRRSILEGDYSYCDSSKCASMQSVLQKQKQNDTYQKPYELIHKNNIQDLSKYSLTSITPNIISFDDDPTCNLSCPSCRKSLIVLNQEESHQKLQKQFELLNECKENIDELWLCGAGDPFAADSYKRLLANYDFSNIPNLKIRIDTNGILFNEKTWNTTLKNVQDKINLVAVSVDASKEESYSKIRRGGNFKTLLKNLQFLSQLKEEKNFTYLIRMIVQKENFEEMPEFVKLGEKLNVDYVVFSEIQNWGTFSTEEYEDKAVHLESNTFYPKFCTILKDPIFSHKIVNLGNIINLYNKVNNEK